MPEGKVQGTSGMVITPFSVTLRYTRLRVNSEAHCVSNHPVKHFAPSSSGNYHLHLSSLGWVVTWDNYLDTYP